MKSTLRAMVPTLLGLMLSNSSAELSLPDPKFPFQIPFDACESIDEVCLKYSVSAGRIVVGSPTSYPGTAYFDTDTSFSAGLLIISPDSYYHTARGNLFAVEKLIISHPRPETNPVSLSIFSGIQRIGNAELWWNTYLSGNNLQIDEAVLHSSREQGRAGLGLSGTSHAKVVRNGNESFSSIVGLDGAASVGLLDATIGWGQIEYYPGSVTINEARGSFNIYSRFEGSTLSILSGDYSLFWEGRENSVLKLGVGHKNASLLMYDSSELISDGHTLTASSDIWLRDTAAIKVHEVALTGFGGRFYNYSKSDQSTLERVVLSYGASYQLGNGMANELKDIEFGDGSRLTILGSGTQLIIDSYNITPELRVETTTTVGLEASLLLGDVRIENKDSRMNLESFGSLIANNIFSRGSVSVSVGQGGIVQIGHGLVSESTTMWGDINFTDNTGFLYIGSGDRKYQTMPGLIAREDGYSITVGSNSAPALIDGNFSFSNGSGRLIKVESGIANLHDSFFTIRLTDDPSARQQSDGLMINKQPSASVISLNSGKVFVANETERPLQPGSFVPILTAQEIQVQLPTRDHLIHWKQGADRILTAWGKLQFSSVNGEDANHFFPELLRVGCASSLTLSGNCSVDVFGARVAKVLALPPVDTYKLKFVGSPEAAMEIINSAQVQVLAANADNVYDLTSGERTVSSISVGGLVAVAEVNSYSTSFRAGDISIAIRGTITLDNWLGNLGFQDPDNEILREYVSNLSSFISTVIRANPGSTIRLTGHSLGGGLSNFLGYVSGLESVGFNAPSIEYLVDYYASGGFRDEVAQIKNVTARTVGDLQHILNIRAAGDVVSQLPVFSENVGQLISVNTLNSNLLLYLDASTRFNKLKAAYDYHRMAFVIDQVSNVEASSIASIKHNGVTVYENPGLSFSELLELGRRQVIEPVLSSGAVKSVFAAVSPGLLYFVDPDPGFVFEFTFNEGSARFNRFFTPNISLAEDAYAFSVLMGGEWVSIGTFSGGRVVELPAGYDKVRMVSSTDLGDFFGDEDVFFAVTFGPGDKYEGSISSVPEVHVWAMWLLGLAFVLRGTIEARRAF